MTDGQGIRVRPGSTVRIRQASGIEEEWTIVPPFQASTLRSRLSEMSPLGFALIGHMVGDQVTVRERDGRRSVTIIDVTTP